MEIDKYIESKKELLGLILLFIDDDKGDNCHFSKLINFINENKISENEGDLSILIYILCDISTNHHRKQGFFDKIDKIINHYIDHIKKIFSESEIFSLFGKNRRFIYFLLEKNIISKNGASFKNYIKDVGNARYFQLELDQIRSKASLASKQEVIQHFNIIRLKGENPSKLSTLIREDSIKEFVQYILAANIPLTSTIKKSIFDTDSFLNDSTSDQPSLIEYAAFYGSIRIFLFLKTKGVPLNPSLWIYAIHGRNRKIIRILEESDIKPPMDNYINCCLEAVRCHHNELVDYFLTNYIDDIDYLTDYAFKYHNFFYFPSTFNNYKLVKGNYADLVMLLYKKGLFSPEPCMLRLASENNCKPLVNFLSESLNEYPLGAFKYSKMTTFSVKNPKLEVICQHAFYMATELTTVILPPTVKTIEIGAFSGCSNLRKIILPQIKEINEYTFSKCVELRKIKIPFTVEVIKMCAFSGCVNLKRVEFESPSFLTKVEKLAFYGCESLKESTSPSGIDLIKSGSIEICLKSNFSRFNESIKVKPTSTFEELIEIVTDRVRIDPFNFHLFFRSETFQDYKEIQDYALPDRAVIHVVRAHCLRGAIPLYIDMPNGKSYATEYEKDRTILSIKERIEYMKGIPAVKQHLFYKNIELENDKELQDYSIKMEQNLQLAVESDVKDVITIYVSFAFKTCATYSVSPSESIEKIKNQSLEKIKNVKSDFVALSYLGKQLEEEKKLADYNIHNGAKLVFVKRKNTK